MTCYSVRWAVTFNWLPVLTSQRSKWFKCACFYARHTKTRWWPDDVYPQATGFFFFLIMYINIKSRLIAQQHTILAKWKQSNWGQVFGQRILNSEPTFILLLKTFVLSMVFLVTITGDSVSSLAKQWVIEYPISWLFHMSWWCALVRLFHEPMHLMIDIDWIHFRPFFLSFNTVDPSFSPCCLTWTPVLSCVDPIEPES